MGRFLWKKLDVHFQGKNWKAEVGKKFTLFPGLAKGQIDVYMTFEVF